MIINPIQKLENFLLTRKAEHDSELLEKLEDLQVPYEVTGAVLHLDPALKVLDEEQILSHLVHAVDRRKRFCFEIHREIGSTNTHVLEQLKPGELFVCLAEMQSAGKGRRGRQWISPFGRNVYLTIGTYMNRPMSELEGLSLVVGMQAVDALRQLGLADVGLKWPNDLLLGSGKMGGILVEIKSQDRSGTGVVMGTGINLMLSSGDTDLIDQPWSAAATRIDIDRNQLAGVFGAKLIRALQEFENEGFSKFAGKWDDYNLFAGKQVRVIRGAEEIVGTDRGVDQNGNLLLERAGDMEVHNSGEVSLRPVAS